MEEDKSAFEYVERIFRTHPFDSDGMSTSQLVYLLMRHFYENQENQGQTFTPEDLHKLFCVSEGVVREPLKTVEMVCRQAELAFLIEQSPPQSKNHRFNVDWTRNNVEFRKKVWANIERAINDPEFEKNEILDRLPFFSPDPLREPDIGGKKGFGGRG